MGRGDPKQSGGVSEEEKPGVMGCLIQENLGGASARGFPGSEDPRTAGTRPCPPPATARPAAPRSPEKRVLPNAPSHNGFAPATQ